MAIILASASPRRQELFRFVSESFEVIPANVDETIPDSVSAEDTAQYLAEKKAFSLKRNVGDIVVGCDTVVVLGNAVLGKPVDSADATAMLHMLSGKVHKVITGVCIVSDKGKNAFAQVTKVEFYPLTDEEIDSYVATGDPMDKAGAYGIQSEGCVLVKGIKGDFFNVVGLPVARLKRALTDI
ncbi:MAG: Maf family protein [Oscillospiraceae bacterium]|nr:Maf family protein [Oscillospiraceae bacterium]